MAFGHHVKRALEKKNHRLRWECIDFMQTQRLRIKTQLDAMERRIMIERNDGFRSRAQLVRECELTHVV